MNKELRRNTISAIIIAKNADGLIEDCLKSIKWVDEIVLVDDASTDKTISIAKKHNALVVNNKSDSFARRREKGARMASGEWLLFIDTDERVTPALKKEILKETREGNVDSYAIPRQNIFLGRKMRWGGWWPDYVLRLIKKGSLESYTGDLHEQPVIKGSTAKLKNYFIHITHRSLSEMVEKTNKWSEIEARLMFEAKHPPMNVRRFATAMLREFWYRAVLKLGFLDGLVGVIEIIYQMFSRFISYAKLWEMQNKTKKTV